MLFQCVYRSPNNGDECIEELGNILSISQHNNNFYKTRMIDFNWKSTVIMSLPIPADVIRPLFSWNWEHFLIQYVRVPTRIRDNDTPSMLDPIFNEDPNVISDVAFNSPIGNSDHVCSYFKVNVNFAWLTRTFINSRKPSTARMVGCLIRYQCL